MRRVGIVDLGSNTSRLVVYKFQPGAWFRLEDEIREPVRLGEGLAAHGMLSPAAVERGLAALNLYADYARATNLDSLEVVATSAVRDASNREDFLRAARVLGHPVEVLSGEDEAEHGVLAVANSLTFSNAWVMDLGGGSAQLSRMKDRLYAGGRAYPLGAVRLTEAFLSSDPPKSGEVTALEKTALFELGPALRALRADGLPLVAMGGTIRNLARAVQKAEDYPLDLLHGYFLSREDLEGLVSRLLTLKAKDRAAVGGIHPDRADVILAGALVYRLVLREAGLPGLTVSGQGVREGAFYRRFLKAPHLVDDVRDFSIGNLFALYPQPLPHTERVRGLARRIFDSLQPLHGYGAGEARLLDDAARLHDIGMAVGYHDHHKHGAYLVSSGSLPGLTPREHALLMLLVQYHRKGDPKLGTLRVVTASGDQDLLLRLSACLRLAEYLERSRAGRVEDVIVAIEKSRVVFRLAARELPRVEIWEARKQAGLFRKAFGRDLVLEAITP